MYSAGPAETENSSAAQCARKMTDEPDSNSDAFLDATAPLFRPILTKQEADILLHTSSNGRYVSGEALAIDLGRRGLLYDHGPQQLAGGAHYLVMTGKGRTELNAWKAAQPPPPKRKARRMSEQFRAWRAYLEATCNRMPFPKFLKEVWPHRNEYR